MNMWHFQRQRRAKFIGKHKVFSIFWKSQKMIMKLKHMDVDAIVRPFWAHLGVLWRPLGAILGVLGLI